MVYRINPPAVTAMMIIVLFPLFGVLGFEESASTLGREVIWLIIAMLMMGAAVEKTGMDKRITYNMLVFTRGNMNLITLALITAGFILTFFVPNAIGRVVVLVPIALGIVHSIGGDENPNVGKASMFAITYTPIICAVGSSPVLRDRFMLLACLSRC
ncbi:SLC13 family permease [Geomicrobium sp. JCM 19039]|uniref:SLC13 family permease n=1 Tax=Geomicrobium sp. JCM 19039 TaxID=1460636 RepID=UPI00187C377E|nr:SLC13 family permease [Geomicrobium sp. JCM 19039]